MKKLIRNYSLVTKSKFDFVKTLPTFVLLAVLLLNFSNSFAQEKIVNQQEWQAQLDEVNLTIQKIDVTTQKISDRIAGVPPENLDPYVTTQLNNLQIQRDQNVRVKVSIEAMLNFSQSMAQPTEIKEIPASTFLSLPKENQDQILAHPERYKVIESK